MNASPAPTRPRARQYPPSPVVKFASLRCTDCGAKKLFAFSAGREAETFSDSIKVTRAIAPSGWCEPCWLRRFGARGVA